MVSCEAVTPTNAQKKRPPSKDDPKKNERIKLCDDYSIAQIGYIVKEDKTI